MEKILVTGCAGYIGSTLVGLLLEKGYTVYGLDNLMFQNGSGLMPHLNKKNFKFIKGDVRNREGIRLLLKDCDAVMPLAALVGAPLCDKSPHAAKQINETAIIDLVADLSPKQRIIYPNTNSGYGTTDGNLCTEECPLNPISIYGQTKCEAENSVLDHPNSTSLRLATVFGSSPRMRLDLMVNDFASKLWQAAITRSKILSFIDNNDPVIELYEPNYKRNAVGVKDVARAFEFCLNGRIYGEYNVANHNANLTKLELAHKVCKTLGISESWISIGEGRDPDQRNCAVSSAKLIQNGFYFAHDLEDGIREVAFVVSTHSPDQLKSMRNV